MAIESPKYTVESKEGDIEIRNYVDFIMAQVDVEADYDKALTQGFRILAGYIFGANHKKTKLPITAPVTGTNLLKSEKIPMTVPVTEEDKSEKIDMTAPVSAEERSEKIDMTAPVSAEERSEKIDMTAPVSAEERSEKIDMTVPVTEEESDKISMTAPVIEDEIEKHVYRISFTMPSKYTLESLPIPDDERIKFKEIKDYKTAVIKFSGRAKEKLAQKEINILKAWLEENNIQPKSNFIVAQYNHPLVPGFLRRNEIIVKI
ncbi:MAG: heme-binding protein [Methanobacterium sp.]|nr:heme-binding protein [Methanobacterium sp.]